MRRSAIHVYHEAADGIANALRARVGDREVIAWSSPEEFRERIGEVEVLVTQGPPRDAWSRAKRLRLIHGLGAGVDDLLPAEGLAENVQICGVRGVFAAETSEHAIAMMLALERALPTVFERQRNKSWQMFPVGKVEGRTVGIVGLGEVGRRIARIASAIGMRVLGTSRSLRAIPDIDVRPLEMLLPDAEHLVICTPRTPATRGLISAAALARLPDRAYVINVGRGGVVDEDALLTALTEGRVGGAAMDVFEDEPLTRDGPWWTAPNTIVTPHIAGLGRNYLARAAEVVVENLERLDRDAPLICQVDRVVGY
jgi:D-2-hydroxyacid dehydrogenase (NADP+)